MSSAVTLEDGSVWPNPERASELAWKARYGGALTEQELMVLASVADAYVQLCLRPEFRQKMPMMRRALKEET